MFSICRILTLASLLCVSVLATPVEVAAPAKTSCNPVATFNAKFDNLAVGSNPADGFAGASWSGFTVATGASADLTPKSGANILLANSAETSSIIAYNNVLIEIASFYFGCTAEYPGLDTVYPASCSIMVTSLPATHALTIESSGPYSFSYDISAAQGAPGNLTRVDLNVPSTEFYFQIVSGLASSQLYLDNVVIESQVDCP